MDVVGEARSLPVIFFNGVTEDKKDGRVRFNHLFGVDNLQKEVSQITKTRRDPILMFIDGLASSPECRSRFPVNTQEEYAKFHRCDMTGCSIFVMRESSRPSVGTVFNPYAYFGEYFLLYFPNRTPPENDVPPPPDHPDSNLNDSNVQSENNDTPTQDQNVASGSRQNNQETDVVREVSLLPVIINFDGGKEVRTRIDPLLDLGIFRRLVSRMTITTPDSLLIYIDGLVPSPHNRLRFRITKQEDIGLLARNPGSSIFVMPRSSRASLQGTYYFGDVMLTPHVDQRPRNSCPDCEEARRNGTRPEFRPCVAVRDLLAERLG